MVLFGAQIWRSPFAADPYRNKRLESKVHQSKNHSGDLMFKTVFRWLKPAAKLSVLILTKNPKAAVYAQTLEILLETRDLVKKKAEK
jgi:hypothetical protein